MSPNPIWVVNPYTGEQVNVEPLFRFNAEPRNPLIQPIPLARTLTVLSNVDMFFREKFVRENHPSEEIIACHLRDMNGLRAALSQMTSSSEMMASPCRQEVHDEIIQS